MALLAEAKRKTKYGLDPRNTNWSNDDSKFGQRLMEKMGWEKGKGLGAKENGMTEHIKASYKSDTRGLGCTPQDADAWIAHQDDFNELLKNLNSQSGSSKQEVKSHTGKKVEDGQKRYYGRFARGRVQTLRSTEDLDCIFGRRKVSEPTTPESNSAMNSDSDADGAEEKRHGLTTVTSSSSVQEYFAKKMAEMKARREAASGKNSPSSEMESEKNESTEVKVRSGQEKEQRVPPVYGAVNFSYSADDNIDKTEDETSGSKDENSRDVTSSSLSRGWYKDWAESSQEGKSERKHRKKKKQERDGVDDESLSTQLSNLTESKSGKESVRASEEGNKACEEDQVVKKKKKKKGDKKGDEEVVTSGNLTQETSADAGSERKKKKKSKKRKKETEDDCDDEDAKTFRGEETLGSDDRGRNKKRKLDKKNADNEVNIEEKHELLASERSTDIAVDEKIKSMELRGEKKKGKSKQVNKDCMVEVSLESREREVKKKKRKERAEKDLCSDDICSGAGEKLSDDEKSKVREEKKKKRKKVELSNEGGNCSDPENEQDKTVDSESGQTGETSDTKHKRGHRKLTRRERTQRKKERKLKKKEKTTELSQWFPGSNIGEIEGYHGLIKVGDVGLQVTADKSKK